MAILTYINPFKNKYGKIWHTILFEGAVLD